jgi:thiosulfate reductase cytochrome b subunit
VITGLIYLVWGIFSGHFRLHLLPQSGEFNLGLFFRELKDHLRMRIPSATEGPHYGLLQKFSYLGVVFLALPLMVLTGFAMSPAITSAFPMLLKIFGGFQSARTLHFFAAIALNIFLIVHVAMVIRSGFKKQIRAMTIGKSYERPINNQPS